MRASKQRKAAFSMDRRQFLAAGVSGCATVPGFVSGYTQAPSGANAPTEDKRRASEELYNGIRLPASWPPKDQVLSSEPMPVPYLQAPPAIIPIDVGRQLFVDDFLIEKTTLQRTYHRATYHPASPVLKPDKPWEQTGRDPA